MKIARNEIKVFNSFENLTQYINELKAFEKENNGDFNINNINTIENASTFEKMKLLDNYSKSYLQASKIFIDVDFIDFDE